MKHAFLMGYLDKTAAVPTEEELEATKQVKEQNLKKDIQKRRSKKKKPSFMSLLQARIGKRRRSET